MSPRLKRHQKLRKAWWTHLFEERTELKIEDKKKIEPLLAKDNFYSHFPMVMAMSDNNDKPFNYSLARNYGFKWNSQQQPLLCLWSDFKELVFQIPNHDVPLYQYVNKVHVSTKLTSREEYRNEEFGRDYIFDLQETIDVKNFKHNYKRFERDQPDVEWKDAKMIDAFCFIEKWFYNRYQRLEAKTEIPDLGHTIYLCANYEKFPELRAKVIKIDNEIKAFSLWGPLTYERAVHIILKCDTSLTYLSDYARYRTYLDMLVDKFVTVNDGGDMGVHGLRIYKLKLRPKYVIPLYSWVLKSGQY